MKVLVADSFEQSGLEGLQSAGCEVVYQPDVKDDSLTEAVRATAADVLVVRSTKVTAAMLDAGRLALIVRAGAGYNTIDVAAASTRGIYVSNCPGKNAIAVAELTFGLILALDRRIPDNVADLRAGRWNKKSTRKPGACAARRSAYLGSAASRRKSSDARPRSGWVSWPGAGGSTGSSARSAKTKRARSASPARRSISRRRLPPSRTALIS